MAPGLTMRPRAREWAMESVHVVEASKKTRKGHHLDQFLKVYATAFPSVLSLSDGVAMVALSISGPLSPRRISVAT